MGRQLSLSRATTSGIGPNLWQVAPGLGPPRPAQHGGFLSKTPRQTVPDAHCVGARPTGRRGGFPTGRPWVFASGDSHMAFLPASVALFRGPVPRIAAILAGHYCRRDAAGPHEATQGELSSRMAALTTGGDLNPTCLGLLGPLVSGGLVAGRRSRRTRNWLLRTALAYLGPAQCQEPFPISSFDFSSDDTRKYIR
jgi:hypothetical protein